MKGYVQANRDDNGVVALMGVSSVDGVTPVPLTVDPTTGRLRCTSVGTGASAGTPSAQAKYDDNYVPAGLAETDDAARTLIPLICTPDGGLLIKVS